MNYKMHILSATFLLAGTLALSQGASALQYLTPAQVDATKLLPPPPADGSKQTAWSFKELMHLQKTRTKAELEQAKTDSKDKSAHMFANVLGPDFDLEKLPQTASLFKDVRAEEDEAAKSAKVFFKRNRPWIHHPDLNSCSKSSGPQTSYPSGHSTMAYSMGVILAHLIPEKSQIIMARSASYAEGRLICGQHYRRDIMAGEAFGTAIGIQLMANPAFEKKMEAAKAELVAAHLTK